MKTIRTPTGVVFHNGGRGVFIPKSVIVGTFSVLLWSGLVYVIAKTAF